MNNETMKLLKEICNDFGEYSFLSRDRYKGAIIGGHNLYCKVNDNDEMGVIFGKKDTIKFGLDKFPKNFATYGRFDSSKSEYGYTGETLVEVLKHIKTQISK